MTKIIYSNRTIGNAEDMVKLMRYRYIKLEKENDHLGASHYNLRLSLEMIVRYWEESEKTSPLAFTMAEVARAALRELR